MERNAFMNIRLVQAADIPGMLRLLTQVCNVHQAIRPDIFMPDGVKYDETALQELLKDPERPIFVAVEGDFLKGYCFCIHRDYTGSTVCTHRKELYIDDLCVDETCRGQGVATALYDHVKAYARDYGCAFITLNVWCGNDNAMRFYEHAGLIPRSITMETKL